MANANPDFTNYMEELQAAEAVRVSDEAMFGAHELWRTTTWSGWVVVQLIGIGNHFHPFFLSVADALKEDRSISFRLLSHFVRMLVVVAILVACYVVARLLQMLVGTEIFSEQEIVIVEEIPRSRAEKEGIVEGEEELSPEMARKQLAKLEAQQAPPKQEKAPTRRSARDKKQI